MWKHFIYFIASVAIMVTAVHAIAQLSINQYYDIETNTISGTLNSSMDFQCTTTNSGGFEQSGGTAARITPVNDARTVRSGRNANGVILQNESNINVIVGKEWDKNSVKLFRGGTIPSARSVNFFVTNQGNYARITSSTVSNGFCEIDQITTGNSTLAQLPFFVPTSYVPIQTFTSKANNSQSFFYSNIDGGVFYHNNSFNALPNYPALMNFNYDLANNYLSTQSNAIHLRQSIIQFITFDKAKLSFLENQLDCRNEILAGITGSDFSTFNGVANRVSPMCNYRRSPVNIQLPNPPTSDILNTSMIGAQGLYHFNSSFDSGANRFFIDDSGQNRFLRCTIAIGCPRLVNDSFVGLAAQFNGTQNLTLNLNFSNTNTNFSNGFTIGGWFNLSNTSDIVSSKKNTIVDKTGVFEMAEYTLVPNVLIFQFFNVTGGFASNILTSKFNYGDLFFAAFTYDPNARPSFKGYFNGVNEFGATYIQGEINTSESQTFIGSNELGTARLNGTISELFFFNRTFTALEILNLYQHQNLFVINPITGGVMVNQTVTQATNRFNFTIAHALYNLTSFNIIYGVQHIPQFPQNNNTVSVIWVSSLPSDSTVFYRSRNITQPDIEASYSTWSSSFLNDSVVSHDVKIDGQFIIEDKYYQYYVVSGGINNTNNNLYYNFTVGGFAVFVNQSAILPSSFVDLSNLGFCTQSTCVYIFSFIIISVITILGFFIGGINLGLGLFTAGITTFTIIGMLPQFLIIPIIVIISIVIARLFGVFGGGSNA